MTVVINAQVNRIMLENIIEFIRSNVDDPNENARRKQPDAQKVHFVRIKDGRGLILSPQIMVDKEAGMAPSSTGIFNQIRTPSFGILVHGKTYGEVIDLTDEVWDMFVQDPSDFFKTAKMHKPVGYLTEPNFYLHESGDQTWYGKFSVSFQYLHYW